MQNPLISIIVPVYNSSIYLDRCIQSLLAQTYPNLEIILIDDGSTDDSPAKCDEYAQKYTHISVIHQPNQGVSAARNRGIKKAKGEWMGFVDSDDYCAADMYEILYSLISKYNTEIAAVGYYTDTYNGRFVSSSGLQEGILEGENATSSCVQKFASLACNKLFAKALFTDIQFPEGKVFEDLFICYRLYDKAGKVAVTDKPVYYYNKQNENSITSRSFSVRKLDYLEASSALLAFCRQKKYFRAEKIILQERAWHITGFLRQMAACGFSDMQVIKPLQQELRTLLMLYLKSRHKITSKIFAVCCCVSFPLAAKIYQILY